MQHIRQIVQFSSFHSWMPPDYIKDDKEAKEIFDAFEAVYTKSESGY